LLQIYPNLWRRDKAAVGGSRVESHYQYIFNVSTVAPAHQNWATNHASVDSRNFLVSKNIATAVLTVKPGGMRELHCHPDASEWQCHLAG
jgi:oxalate decarboxylase